MSPFGNTGTTNFLLAPFKTTTFFVAVKSMLSILCSCSCSVVFSFSFYAMSFDFSYAYPVLPINLLYNKAAVVRALDSYSASASRVAAIDPETGSYNLLILYLKNVFIFATCFFVQYFL